MSTPYDYNLRSKSISVVKRVRLSLTMQVFITLRPLRKSWRQRDTSYGICLLIAQI